MTGTTQKNPIPPTTRSPQITGAALTEARPLPVLRRTLADSWRSLVGWALGLTAVITMYLPLYPSMNTPDMAGLLESLPPELIQTLGYDQITSGPGYTQATFFGLVGFALFTIAAVSWGSAAIAGAEESGRLELTLAHGVARTQYALESAAAVVIRLLILATYSGLLIAVLNRPSELGIAPGNLVAAEAALVGLSLLTASAALAAGALTGRRVVGTAAGATVAALGYVLNAIGNQNADLDWVQQLSPFSWAYGNTPLADGADWVGLGLLYGSSVLLIGVAVGALQRRDVLG